MDSGRFLAFITNDPAVGRVARLLPLQRSDSFCDVRQHVVERRLTMSARDYVGYLSTVSAYLQLPETERQQVYDAIAQILPATVEIAADITVHLARRRSD